MTGIDPAWCDLGNVAVGTVAFGWRFPGAVAATARRLGPPPWRQGTFAVALVVNVAADGIAADAAADAPSGAVLLEQDLTALDATPDRLERAELLVAAVADAHRAVVVDAYPPHPPDGWPLIGVDCHTGLAWVNHAAGRTRAMPAAALERRWVDLAARLQLAKHPDRGWMPALHL